MTTTIGSKFDEGKVRISLIPAEIRQAVLALEGEFSCDITPDTLTRLLQYEQYLTALMLVCASLAEDPTNTTDGLLQVAEVLEYGAKVYGEENWKLVAPNRYIDAVHRHIGSLGAASEPAHDAESGLPHLAHIGANLVFLAWQARQA